MDSDYYDEGIEFVTESDKFGNYRETGNIMDKAEKMVSLFFGKDASVSSGQKYGCFYITVSFIGEGVWNDDRSHKNSRSMIYGKNHTGYSMADGKSLKGYTHPYPNDVNGMGAAQEEEWFNSTNGNPWFNADRNNHSVKNRIDKWSDPEYYDAMMNGDFDEY